MKNENGIDESACGPEGLGVANLIEITNRTREKRRRRYLLRWCHAVIPGRNHVFHPFFILNN